MNNFLFLLVILVLLLSIFRKPGAYLAYILLFQSLNLNIFESVNLYSIRHSTTILLFPLFIIANKNIISKQNFENFFTNKITVGYVLLSGYIILYSLYLGKNYEIEYMSMFLFPSFFLFLIAGTTVQQDSILKDFFWGIIFFTFLSLVYLFVIKGYIESVNFSRRDYGEYFGFGGPIGQARMAGIWAISFLLLLLKEISKKVYLIYLGMFIISLYWLAATGTRGTLLALAFCLIMYLLFNPNKKYYLKKFIFIAVIVFIALIYMGISDSSLYTRTNDLLAPGKIERMPRFERWLLFFDYFGEVSAVGLGPGGWSKFIWGGFYRYPHNMFIEYVVEYGIVGLISFLLIVLTGFRNSIILIKNSSNLYKHSIGLGWIFYFINLMFSSSLLQGSLQFYIYSAILGVITYRVIKEDHSN